MLDVARDILYTGSIEQLSWVRFMNLNRWNTTLAHKKKIRGGGYPLVYLRCLSQLLIIVVLVIDNFRCTCASSSQFFLIGLYVSLAIDVRYILYQERDKTRWHGLSGILITYFDRMY